MQSGPVLAKITRSFTAEDRSLVITALHQDTLLWNSLEQVDLLDQALSRAGQGAEALTPASLGLLAAGCQQLPARLRADASDPLPPEIQQRTLRALDDFLTAASAPITLANAGLFALALRERYRLAHAWLPLFNPSQLNPAALSKEAESLWLTSLACLYGITASPLEWLRTLLTTLDPQIAVSWAVHVLLCQPKPANVLAQTMLELLQEQGFSVRVDWLARLQQVGRSDLAAQVAKALVKDGEPVAVSPDGDQDLDHLDMNTLSGRAFQLQQLASIHQAAGNPRQAMDLLAAARKLNQRIDNLTVVQLAALSAQSGQLVEGIPSTAEIVARTVGSTRLQAALAAGLPVSHWDNTLSYDAPEDAQHPLVNLRQAQVLFASGKLAKAQDLARRAAPRLLALVNDPSGLTGLPADWQPADILDLLLDTDLLPEARQLAGPFLAMRPVDPALFVSAGRVFERCGDLPAAVELATLSMILNPEDMVARKRLALVCENAGDWNCALEQREILIQHDEATPVSGWLDLANCALHAGNAGRTLEICSRVLEMDPDHGRAHSLTGQALIANGFRQEAIEHLDRATLLAPEEPAPWLHLAAIQRENGDVRRELETLRAAVLAAPESAELHFALATSFLDNHLPSEALPALREAQRRSSDSVDIAWKLAETLYRLGHEKEARQVVDASRRRWPRHPFLAVIDAQMLMDNGETTAAVPALEAALQTDQPDPAWYLLYAQALLKYRPDRMLAETPSVEPGSLSKARQALRQCFDRFEARILLAEVLAAQGEHQAAFDLYRDLSELPDAAGPQWRWRVQAGLGQVALALGQTEVAVAALREAAQTQPDHLSLQRSLAEAYQAADLRQEAAQTARQALSLEPDQLDNLTWFINLLSSLGRENETVDALKMATQLAPGMAPLWNRLANLQAIRGEKSAAQKSLASLMDVVGLDTPALRTAARTYLSLSDPAAALDCLERALVMAGPDPDPGLLTEVAALRVRRGNPEAALDLAQQAAAAAPREAVLQILQADLLTVLNRSDSALACLDQAASVREAQPDAAEMEAGRWLPDDWGRTALEPSAIAARRALLLRAQGDLEGALQSAEQGLAVDPSNLALRFLAADLAGAMFDDEKAARLAVLPGDSEAPSNVDWLPALVALQAGLALQTGEDPSAGNILEAHSGVGQEHPLLLAIQARLLVRIGQTEPAQKAYLGSAAALAEEEQRIETGPVSIDLDRAYRAAFLHSQRLALAEAALDLGRWQEAVDRFQQVSRGCPAEARAHLRLARALTVMAEQQIFCDAIACRAHAPGSNCLDNAHADMFEHAISAASSLSQAPVIATWQARGRAAFHPSLQNAPALARLAPSADHAAALFGMMRAARNSEYAVRIAHHYPENAHSLAQLALCYQGLDTQKGLALAQRAVEKQPLQPLFQATLALLAEKAGHLEAAQQALESALQIWMDEPEWHAWAARLASENGDTQQAIDHWEACLDLDPTAVNPALNLAHLYLARQETPRAIEVLETIGRKVPEQQQIWLALSNAQRTAGDLEAALVSAERAGECGPESPAPLLAAGEIALQMGCTDQALLLARSALEVGPADPDCVLFLSHVLVQNGSLPEGLQVLENALPALRASLPVMLERAGLIHRLRGSQAALPVYLELAHAFPEEVEVLSRLAQSQSDCGDAKAAERTAHTALHLDPEQPQLNLLLGRIQHAAGQLDQAIHFLSEAVRLAPGDLDGYLELGQAYLDRREHLQALRTFQQAIKVSPRDYRPFYHAALVLRESKDYPGAEAMLRRAAELDPEDLNIRRQLGAVVALNLVHNTQEANATL